MEDKIDTAAIEIIRCHINAMLDELGQTPDARGPQVTGTTTAKGVGDGNVPTDWRYLKSRTGEVYSWPELLEEYTSFDIYEGRSAAGQTTQWAIGKCERYRVWGKDRLYFIVFRLGQGGGSKQPICEFLETDDYESTRNLIAIIRGSGGPRGQRMFDPSAGLPAYYSGMRIETYRDRIPQPGSWNKLAVVAHEDDFVSMLRHAAIQVLLRH